MASEDLKKIEEQAFDPRLTFEERAEGERVYGRACEDPEAVAQELVAMRRDRVKLARALEEALSVMERVQAQSVKSRRWTTSMAWDGAIIEGKRTLREVANG